MIIEFPAAIVCLLLAFYVDQRRRADTLKSVFPYIIAAVVMSVATLAAEMADYIFLFEGTRVMENLYSYSYSFYLLPTGWLAFGAITNKFLGSKPNPLFVAASLVFQSMSFAILSFFIWIL